jgi:hypothetical protein
MGHEAIVTGRILAGDGRAGAGFEQVRALQARNRAVIRRLPVEDVWPWLTRRMFQVPLDRPVGVYRTQVITFGASYKDDPQNRACWDAWLSKWEDLLRQLYWWSAQVTLRTDFEPERTFSWTPTAAAMEGVWREPPQPVSDWTRTCREAVSPP